MIIMDVKYCPKCQREVTAIRPEMDFCLLFILLFTGIGWLIYIIIYFSQPESRCIICHSHVHERAPNQLPYGNQSYANPQINYQQNAYGNVNAAPQSPYRPPQTVNLQTNQVPVNNAAPQRTGEVKYCSYCGAEIRKDAKFCSSCSAPLE
jgi:hypothetical protein